MAFNMQKNNVLLSLLLVLAPLPLITSTNIDCKGKAFHCVNSTHFMICVDIGHGLSSTIEDFMIPCPTKTECRITNRFECEYPPIPSTTTLASTTEILDFTTTVDEIETALFSEANNVEHSTTMTTVSPIRELNDLKDSVITEQIDTSIVIESTQKISEDVMDQTKSPQINEIYTENYLELSTTTSGNGVDVSTTVDPIFAITTFDTTFTEPVSQIVEITQSIDDSLTYSSQYDTTSISVVSAESLKDSIRKDKDNIFVDVLAKHSTNGDIEVTTDVGFVPIDFAFAQNTESVTTTSTLVNENYRNSEAISTDIMTTVTNAMENTLYTTKEDITNNSVNYTATTESLVLSSESEFSTDNTPTDIRTTIFDILNMSPKNAVPTDSNVIDFSTRLMNDFSVVSATEPVITLDPTILLPTYTVPAITEIDNLAFSGKNDFYGTMESTQTEDFITEENTQVNTLVTENDFSSTPSGATINELLVNVVGEEYTEQGRYDGNDSTTEYTETSFTTKSIYNIVDDKFSENITDMRTTIFDVQDTANTSPKNVAQTNSINTDPSNLLMNDLHSLLTTESVATQDLRMTETDNFPFSSKNDVYSTEATHTTKITTNDYSEVNKLQTDTYKIYDTYHPSVITELSVAIIDNDFTVAETYDDLTTEYAEKLLSTVLFSEPATQNFEEISATVTEKTNILSTITADQSFIPTEVSTTSTSYLFESRDQDLQMTESLVSTLTIDLERSSEPSESLSNDSQTQNSNVNLTNIDKDVALTPDMDLLLPTIANDIESATEFLNQVEINVSFYNSNLSKTLENLTLANSPQVAQDKTGGKGPQIIEKYTEASLAIEVNTNVESITTVNTTSDRENFTVIATKLGSPSNMNEFTPIYNMINTDEPEENEIEKLFTATVGDIPEADIPSTTPMAISNVNYDTPTSVIPQVTSQELLTDPVEEKFSSNVPNRMSPLMTTNNLQIEKVTESFKPTSFSSVIYEEININIDERITTSKDPIETDSISNAEGDMHINNLDFTTEDHTTAQTKIQSLYDYKKYYDIVSTENYNSITTQSDIHTTTYESLNYEMVKTTQLNVEKNVGTSSTKLAHSSKSEQDLAFQVGKVVVSTTMTSTQDTQIEQVRNIVIPYTTTENIMENYQNFGNYANENHGETSTLSFFESTNNIDTNILSTPYLTTTDSNIHTLAYENTDYLDHKLKTGVMESEDKHNIVFSNEKSTGSKTNVNNTFDIRQLERASYTTNSIYDTSIVSELIETTTVNLNLDAPQNSTLQPDINIMEKEISKFLTQNEVTTNKNIVTNIDIKSQKNISQISKKEELDDYQILGVNENKEVAENIYHDKVGSNIAYNQISNTKTTSPIPEVVLRTESGKPVHQTVIETISENYTESEIHHSVSSIQNMTHKINASYNISRNMTTRIEETKLSSYLISSQTMSVSENQPSHSPKEVQSSEAATSKLFEKDQNEKVNFDCLYRFRGRYADNENCRRFYICIGKQYPIVGMCPVNTVFSEFRKQCTNNLAHCVRNYVFYCTAEGRFSDIFNNNMYYICVRNNDNKFIRYKLQCENGYYLNKASIQCTPNAIVKPQSTLLESDKSQTSSDTSVSLTNSNESRKIRKGDDLKCEKEGKFPDPSNCKKYYVCSKNKSSFKKKVKSCDSDEVFDRHKEKCVDAESYEC